MTIYGEWFWSMPLPPNPYHRILVLVVNIGELLPPPRPAGGALLMW